MRTCKQAMAIIALVVSLGIVLPSTFGGSALANPSNNPNASITELKCDIAGKAVTYQVLSTDNAASWRDTNSSTVFTVIYSTYEGEYVAIDPADPEDSFHLSGSQGPGNPDKKGKLAKAVVCHSIGTETWTSDGSLGIEGHTYYGEIDNTWYLGMSGPGKPSAKAAGADAHKSKHHGKGKHGR